MPTVQEATQMRGMTAVDHDGEKIGKIEEIYLDSETGQPEWAARQDRAVRRQGHVRAAGAGQPGG